MRFRRPFLLTFSFFLLLWAIGGNSASHSAEIQKIDSEIEQMEEMKRGYEGRALRHENQAEYLQFDQKAVLETRRHLQIAQENRNKAALVQKQIDLLKVKREKLLK
ncbi:MAG: hypothetical protein COT85_00400 [Chlamydiae bacterium CG10_big_fil_rev_8_21_14_0_10_42_34]|nr:MAG: hypothetical protein COT85_00400 [Chlamydiae bacterium CG10_big_fil_rev_8_21_14_0_10_42_34]